MLWTLNVTYVRLSLCAFVFFAIYRYCMIFGETAPWHFFQELCPYSKMLDIMNCCIYLFGVLRHFQHCTGHITMGSWKGRGNQYIQLVKVLYCKLPTNSKQLPAFPLEAMPGTEPRPQRWEARVLPLCHRGPLNCCNFPIQI